MEELVKEGAQNGDTVLISYSGMLGDGTIFDAAPAESPLELVLGQYRALPAFEDAIVGMKPGETRTVTVSFEDAFGDYKEDMIAVVGSKQLPQGMTPEIGKMLQVQTPSGDVENVIVTRIDRNKVTLDANHPLAGKDLLFEITLKEIR